MIYLVLLGPRCRRPYRRRRFLW